MRPIPSLLDKNLTRPDWLATIPRENDFLWLDKNENLDTAYLAWLNDAILPHIDKIDLSTYPDLGQLYYDLAQMDRVAPSNILVSTGSDGAIKTVFQSLVEPGDTVCITNPSFAMYDVYCRIFGANTIYSDYSNSEGKISLDIDVLLDNIRLHKPKLVCIPNPDSPTGTVLSREIISVILDACTEADSVLFIDEAYYPFYDNSVAELIRKGSQNLVLCRTFSKAWGLAGVRVGNLIAGEQMIGIMTKTRPMYEIGALSLKIAHLLLPHTDRMQQSVNVIKEGKKYFETQMTALGFQTLETHGNFSHIRFDKHRQSIFDRLDSFVYYRKDFAHQSLKGYTRFSAAPLSTMKKVVEAIASVIK